MEGNSSLTFVFGESMSCEFDILCDSVSSQTLVGAFRRCRVVVMRDFWSMSRVFGLRKYRWWRMEAERECAVVMMRMEELSECDDDEVENAELRKFHFGISFLLCFISVFSSLSRRSRRRWDDNTKSGSRSDLLPPSSSSVNAWALMIRPHGKRWLCVDDLTMSWKFHFIVSGVKDPKWNTHKWCLNRFQQMILILKNFIHQITTHTRATMEERVKLFAEDVEPIKRIMLRRSKDLWKFHLVTHIFVYMEVSEVWSSSSSWDWSLMIFCTTMLASCAHGDFDRMRN